MNDDLISRQAAFLDYQSVCFYVGCGECPFFIDKGCDWERWIENLPSAQPEPKKGEWIINSDGYYPYCSVCYQEPEGRVMTKYCPTCGAKMKGDK